MLERSPLEAAQKRAARAEALAADYALAMDVLGRLAGVGSEHAVADMVLEYAQTVFGSRTARMAVFDRRGRATHVWERGQDGVISDVERCPRQHGADDRDVEVWVGGMSVPILLGDRLLGRIDIEELSYPDALDAYADTIWVFAKVAGMALATVRAMRGFTPICASCKAICDSDGNWHTLEQWLSENADVLLSHGLCPACYRAAQIEAGLGVEGEDAPPPVAHRVVS